MVVEGGIVPVALHCAHGYILCQFLSAETNRRDDGYGGAPRHRRERAVREIIAGIRERCRPDFNLVRGQPGSSCGSRPDLSSSSSSSSS